jgi:cation diffusion facilitator CzcD-associated flavoprotein CzcO
MISVADEDQAVNEVDVAVIGAGFSGLYALHLAREELGLRVCGIEAADDVGGTWYWNRYPGARVDTLSQVYCYSFSPELIAEWDYTERYPDQSEILAYLGYVADRLDLRRSYRFGTRVTELAWDEESVQWELTTDEGHVTRAGIVVSALGCLSAPSRPQFEGLESFTGDVYYTAEWPHHPVPFEGRRVAIIGTGATGIQVIPVVAEEAEHLTVFQRTPNYSTPQNNRPLTPEDQQRHREEAADLHELVKWTFGGNPLTPIERSVKEDSPEERKREFDRMYDAGDFSFWLANYEDVLSDPEANEIAAEYLRDRIRATVADPATAEKLMPRDYPYGTKRQPLDTGYFETYNRDNVTLIDIREDPIREMVPAGIRTESGLHEADAIILATGFDAMTGALNRIRIVGRDGKLLSEEWKGGPRAYLGLAVAGFPNLFTITGPGSPSVLTNMPTAIEQHVEWVIDAIRYAGDNGIRRFEATPEATDRWAGYVNKIAAATLFPSAASWYMGANVPGKPRIFMPYVGGLDRFRRECDEVTAGGYKGFELERDESYVA